MIMSRRLEWVLMVAAGVAAGFAFGSYQPSNAEPPPSAVASKDADDTIEQLKEIKEIKAQVQDINTLLHSGKLRVVVAIYPDSK
jgi:hypothetical protein